jgi:RNA polymerase sigma-70 factor (sigma-E family)
MQQDRRREGAAVDGPVEFEAFVAARSTALLRTAWLLTGDPDRAQDLLQTTLATCWTRWSRIRSDDPEGYVRRVLARTYARSWRRRWNGEVPTEALPETAGPVADDADLRETVRRALAQLPRRQRAVVVLRHFDDLTEAQTAAALGITVGTVKSQHSRAMATLRRSPLLSEVLIDRTTGGER